MAENQIQRVSLKHESIMEYMMVNPAAKLGEVASHFNVSQSWLSVVIHSDAFQQVLAEKKGEMFGATLVPLREKVLGIANLAADKLAETIEQSSPISDKDYILDATDLALKAAGFSPKSPTPAGGVVVNQQNNYNVAPDALASARDKMRFIGENQGTLSHDSATKALPPSGNSGES